MRSLRRILPSAAVLLCLGARAQAGPALFMHDEGFGTMPCITVGLNDPPCALPASFDVLLPNIAGPQIAVPWSAIENTTQGVRDWTQVENVIRPWVNAGKRVALTFHAVAEATDTDQTGIPATPHYLLYPNRGVQGPRKVACRLVSGGKAYSPPVVPVYWDPLFSGPWHSFIAAALAYFANRPEIAYLRFGEGQGDESMVEVMKTVAGPATPKTTDSCVDLWNAADAAVGRNGVFADHLAQAQATVLFAQQAALATPGAPPLFGSYNDIGNFQSPGQQPQPHPFGDPLAVAEAAAGMAPGNEGFGDPIPGSTDESGGFSGIYSWTDPYFAQVGAPKPAAMYMQTSAEQKRGTYTTLPNILFAAMGYGIGTFEMYPNDLYVTFDPTNVSGKNPYVGPSPTPACLSNQVITVLDGQPIPAC